MYEYRSFIKGLVIEKYRSIEILRGINDVSGETYFCQKTNPI